MDFFTTLAIFYRFWKAVKKGHEFALWNGFILPLWIFFTGEKKGPNVGQNVFTT